MRSERVRWHEISFGGQRSVIIDDEMYGIPLRFNKAYMSAQLSYGSWQIHKDDAADL
jgi:hypothetical protein